MILENSIDYFKFEYFKISIDQVKIETKLFPLLDKMKLTMSYKDYMEMQCEFSTLWSSFNLNNERMEILKRRIKNLKNKENENSNCN